MDAQLQKRLAKAVEHASLHGDLIGRISRYRPVRSGPGERVFIDIDPEVYYGRPGPYHRAGEYLVAVDPKTLSLVLLRITAVERADEAAMLGVEPPVSEYMDDVPDASTLMTTARVEAEPLMEMQPGGEPRPATISLEPLSPVVDPRPDVLRRLLALPEAGLVLGALATPGGLVKDGRVPVRLPYRVMLQHVLIVGTTGSGKTTLLKNSIAWMSNDGRAPGVVVLDMNQDFLQVAAPPQDRERLSRDPVYQGVYRGVNPPRSLTILLPLTMPRLEDSPAIHGNPVLDAVAEYTVDVLSPIYNLEPGSWTETKSGPGLVLRQDRITLVPFAVSSRSAGVQGLAGLMPGLTLHAYEYLQRITGRFLEEYQAPPPLQALEAGVWAWLEEARCRRGENCMVEEERLAEYMAPRIHAQTPSERLHAVANARVPWLGVSLLEAALAVRDALAGWRPHMSTVEALYRRLSGLADTGLVDVMYYHNGRLDALGEPDWGRIVEEAEGTPIVADLAWAGSGLTSGGGAPRVVAYRLLAGLMEWRVRLWKRREKRRPVVIIIDEAHQFFPQERGAGEEREASRQVAEMIQRIARLGRARGLGLVFSTHSPRDLHDIILQLSNTRIALRMEKSHAERLDIPAEAREYLGRLPDRHMVVYSHAYRDNYVMASTSLPLVRHHDIPAGL